MFFITHTCDPVIDMYYGFYFTAGVTTCTMGFISLEALRDGDKVWAMVGTGTNQGGRTVTPMTAPSGEQQIELLRSVYKKHQVDVDKIDYIEAHGEFESVMIVGEVT